MVDKVVVIILKGLGFKQIDWLKNYGRGAQEKFQAGDIDKIAN
jgi:hypothetical protein